MTDTNASCILRLNRDFVVISHQVRNGSATRDTTVRAERGQPVAACRFLEGNLILYQPLVGSKLGLQVGVEYSRSSESRLAERQHGS